MSIVNPIEYWDINVNGTLSLLSIMSRYKCHNLIYSSSATVYKPKGFNMSMKMMILSQITHMEKLN